MEEFVGSRAPQLNGGRGGGCKERRKDGMAGREGRDRGERGGTKEIERRKREERERDRQSESERG